ncbi:inner centromere protein isoform X9 [Sagmatias obliquidens]|uniref:inner centromere protein isoform X9 n=1 Tax=Sagmatias obliquidens TaxID=3371155 RepID=UPI000F44120D|nr:inner centromere protein isoform X9 [Lagenorhynchus obliquidens]
MNRAIMGTTAPGPIHLLELCDQKLMEFVCNVDNKDMVWLEEIEEEAERMFTREFSKEPELMPKTPSQKNRRKKRRISYVQDENRDPVRRSRLSRRKTRSSHQSFRRLRSKDKVEKLATVVGENGSVLRRVTRAAAAAAASSTAATPSPTPESPPVLTEKPKESPAQCQLVPMVEIGISERRSAEQHLSQLQSAQAPPPTPAPAAALASQITLTSEEDSTPQKPEAGRLESVTVSLAQNYSLVSKEESAVRRSSRRIARKATKEPAASARIICHSYLERLLNVEVPQKVSPTAEEPSKEAEPEEAAEPEVPKNSGSALQLRSTTKIAISTPGSQPAAGGQGTPSEGRPEAKTDQADGPKEPPQSVRRKRSYKQAVSELDEEQQLEDEELQPPRSKTPSPPCPASKVVRPLRTFLHTVQRNQTLMTPTSTPHSSVKSFMKRNTPLRVDPKCSFVGSGEGTRDSGPWEAFGVVLAQRGAALTPPPPSPQAKERQRLENLRRKEEAEQLRRQKVEEDKRRRLEEVKLKREERLRKVLQARERVEQMKEEKKKQIEQKFAQIDEKTEKAKEERLAEEKAKKKAAAKKMGEVEARRRQEDEARRLRWLQQEEEERRHQELLQRRREEEQERLRKAAEAKRLVEQRELERLQAERELQEREKALRLQKERLQRELEEKKKKEEQQRLAEQRLQEEQEKKAREAAAASKSLNVTVDVQSPACTSYQMTPQGHRAPPKINPDNYGMDLNSDDSTDDEAHPRKPIPNWARGTQLSQAIIHQYYHPPNLLELFGTILPLDLEDIFKKSKPRYHKRTSSAVWNSPPLQGPRVPGSLAYSLKKH